MDQFAQYGLAIVSLGGVVLLWAVLNPLSAVAKDKAGAPSGGAPEADYGLPAYRWYRAYGNLTETAPFFFAAVAAAILAGANPFWGLLRKLCFHMFIMGRKQRHGMVAAAGIYSSNIGGICTLELLLDLLWVAVLGVQTGPLW